MSSDVELLGISDKGTQILGGSGEADEADEATL